MWRDVMVSRVSFRIQRTAKDTCIKAGAALSAARATALGSGYRGSDVSSLPGTLAYLLGHLVAAALPCLGQRASQQVDVATDQVLHLVGRDPPPEKEVAEQLHSAANKALHRTARRRVVRRRRDGARHRRRCDCRGELQSMRLEEAKNSLRESLAECLLSVPGHRRNSRHIPWCHLTCRQ